MLKLKNISFSYPKLPVISHIDFSIKKNRTTAFIGPSGCGKTTLLKIIVGLIQPSCGEVVRDINWGSTGFMFQDFRLLPWRTVYQNINLVLHQKKNHKKNTTKYEMTKMIEDALVITGLIDFANAYPYQLSVGMQQRVGLARALVIRPDLMLLDEPFSSVDGQTRELLIEEFKKICKRKLFTRIIA